MDAVFYEAAALVTAGVSLAMGTISSALAIRRNDRAYLLFGAMGLCLFIFLLLPPAGFIVVDSPPYPVGLLFKRVFIYSYYAISAWFILAYSGYTNRLLPRLVTVLAVAGYIMMALTTEPAFKPAWSIISTIVFGCILALGFIASRFQYRAGQRTNALWLAGAMTIYSVLFLLTAINQFSIGALARSLNMQLFYPMHLHAIFFMLIMGQRLVADMMEKFTIKQNLLESETKWKSFIANTPLLVIELDREGRLININDFGLRLLGYKTLTELQSLNWFTKFVSYENGEDTHALFHNVVSGNLVLKPVKLPIRTRSGSQLVISWSNFPIQSPDGGIHRIVGIGKDVTEEENASQLVGKLSAELAKEQITVSEPTVVNKEIVGSSKALNYALRKAQQVATTHALVLLEGETGVGKELFANLIHTNSSRAGMPFIKVNCGALPKDLIEDELFGHEKGAFTSAIQARKGRFELADGGTIFLDEIAELPPETQPKLLRVLQFGEFERVGGQKTIKVDVRVLVATNRNLASEASHGRFRSDLYYRLNIFPITIPPLRNRKEDLPMLIRHFIAGKSKEYNKQLQQISRADLQKLTDYDWPGNIRELKNVIERSVILSDDITFRLDWWEQGLEEGSDNSLEHMERDHIISVMQKCHWKVNGENGAAEMLAMHPNTLRSRMKKLNIRRPGIADQSGLDASAEL